MFKTVGPNKFILTKKQHFFQTELNNVGRYIYKIKSYVHYVCAYPNDIFFQKIWSI